MSNETSAMFAELQAAVDKAAAAADLAAEASADALKAVEAADKLAVKVMTAIRNASDPGQAKSR
jgi:hypothetical protein